VKALALVALCGCDAVLGLDDTPRACGDGTFDAATPVDVVHGETFSVSWDRDLVVYTALGIPYQQRLPDGQPEAIDLGVETPTSFALAPEGDAVMFSVVLDTPVVKAALRVGGATWNMRGLAPVGAYAGTPSADEFGPRRVLVRPSFESDLQEYEDQDGQWVAIGDLHALDGSFAPNLTPNGLDMVWSGAGAVVIAHRTTRDDWFGDPVQILAGAHIGPQLLDRCNQLFVADSDGGSLVVRRYGH
jgi:hypothetical protein